MAEESFPLPGSSYRAIEKIITSYAELSGETGPAEVAALAGTDASNVSRNNKFLLAIGLIEGKQKKQSTELGKKLARAINFDRLEEQTSVWEAIVDNDEFLQKVISAVRIRRGMDSPSLVNHIAFSAGGTKNAATMAGAAAVLEILIRGKALVDQGGVLVAAEKTSKPIDDGISPPPKIEAVKPSQLFYGGGYPITSNLFSQGVTIGSGQEPEMEMSLRINLQITCTPDELEDLAPKLNRLIAQLGSTTEKREGTALSDSQVKAEGN